SALDAGRAPGSHRSAAQDHGLSVHPQGGYGIGADDPAGRPQPAAARRGPVRLHGLSRRSARMERALPGLRTLELASPRAPFVWQREPAPRERARARPAPTLSGRRLAVRACLDGLAFFPQISNNAGPYDDDRETCRADHLGRLGCEPEDGGQRPGPRTAAVLQFAPSDL